MLHETNISLLKFLECNRANKNSLCKVVTYSKCLLSLENLVLYVLYDFFTYSDGLPWMSNFIRYIKRI